MFSKALLVTLVLIAHTTLTGRAQDPVLQWKFQTRGPVVGSAVLHGGTVYVGSADSTLYAIEAASGKNVWTFRTGGPIKSGVCMAKNKLILNGGDGVLYALEPKTGKVRWTFRTGGETTYPVYGYADYYHSTPVAHDGMLYFGSGDANVYALDAETGKLQWKFKTGDVVHATPAVDSSRVYIGSFDGYFYALDKNDGSLSWKFKSVGQRFFPKGEFQGSPVTDGRLVFVGSRDYNLYALDAEKGYCHWNKSFPKGWAMALTVHDSILYAGTSDDDVMIAMDAADGTERWRKNVQFNVFGAAAVAGKQLYFGSLMGKVFGLDKNSGALRWTFETAGYQTHRARYFPDGDSIDKNDFYGRVQTPEGYIQALHALGGIFSTPLANGNLLIITSTDGGIYCLKMR